jgi:hypothetical protein
VKLRTEVIVVAGILLLVSFFLVILRKNVAKRSELSITVSRLTEIAGEAREFRAKVGRNPRSVSELLTFSPFKPTNRISDGWGNQFIIEVAADGGIKIFSNGEDSKPGGAGDGGTFLPP